MKRVLHILLLICCIRVPSNAQTNKGWDVPAVNSEKISGETYALIIGVSKYKNLPSQLKYADKDALIFHQYLKASGVDENKIHALINESALKGTIWAEVEYLLDVAKRGDIVYVYFSGHGDVEKKTIGRKAYLLPYDSETHGYVSCAIGIPDLKDYFGTLSAQGVQLIFIGDACRVGNLVGGIEGISATAALLQEKWTDEIKILSCQPGQLSQESKQWGNGRGLFSFELINGLCGLADFNKNNEVTLRELELYLMQKVPEAADPHKQDPIIETTNKDFVISYLNDEKLALAALPQQPLLASIDMKGSEELLLERMSDSIRLNHDRFQSAMQVGNYLKLRQVSEEIEATLRATANNAQRKDVSYYEVLPSAYYYYQKIPIADSTNMLTSYMKRNISAELLNNLRDFEALMNGDSVSADSKLAKLAYNLNLAEARELIRQVGVESIVLQQLIGDAKLKKLGFYSSRVLVEATGYLATGNTKALLASASMLDSAIQYTPEMPRLNRVRGRVAELEIENSIINVRPPSDFYEREVRIQPKNLAAWSDLVSYSLKMNRSNKLVNFVQSLTTEMKIADPFFADFLPAFVHYSLGRNDSALFYFERILLSQFQWQHDETDGEVLFMISRFKLLQGKCRDASAIYDVAISKGYRDFEAPEDLAQCFVEKGNKEQAMKYLSLCESGYDDLDHKKMARAYAQLDEEEKTRYHVDEAIKIRGRKLYSALSPHNRQRFSSVKNAFEALTRFYDRNK
jgi:hypothetical protein